LVGISRELPRFSRSATDREARRRVRLARSQHLPVAAGGRLRRRRRLPWRVDRRVGRRFFFEAVATFYFSICSGRSRISTAFPEQGGAWRPEDTVVASYRSRRVSSVRAWLLCADHDFEMNETSARRTAASFDSERCRFSSSRRKADEMLSADPPHVHQPLISIVEELTREDAARAWRERGGPAS